MGQIGPSRGVEHPGHRQTFIGEWGPGHAEDLGGDSDKHAGVDTMLQMVVADADLPELSATYYPVLAFRQPADRLFPTHIPIVQRPAKCFKPLGGFDPVLARGSRPLGRDPRAKTEGGPISRWR